MSTPKFTRTMALTLLCAGLAGCGTDSISMSSEVGGGGARSGYATNRSGAAVTPASGGSLSDGSVPVDGLGVTGDGGVLDGLTGSDPIGGVIEDTLPQLADLLGTAPDATTGGIVPEVAGALAGTGDGVILPGGLGLTGEGGVIADLLGSDVGGDLLGGQGLIASNIAGGNDGLLSSVLGDNPAKGLLAPATDNLPLGQLTTALAGQASLGITGQSGLVADLLGTDLTAGVLPSGGAVGGLLSGGDAGVLGNAVPDGQAPLGAVGNTVSGVLGAVAGNTSSPVGDGLGTVLAPVSDALGNVPVVGDVLGGITGQGSAGLPVSGDPVSALNDVLSPVTGGSGAAPATGALAPVTGALSPVTDAVSSLPVVGEPVGGLLNGVLGIGG
ncbi:hypothetical protein FHS78_003527 [Parvibaculum indicum]|uniref:hypothetical protein n=1 Tax=Parvibaculum indicum TaxID=562969 RepID=UPI001421C5BC|nr:hypothetical protein [Parvibaculum indicum]NIJ43215.1 hypothetical protein [Parvibaculum indicum]